MFKTTQTYNPGTRHQGRMPTVPKRGRRTVHILLVLKRTIVPPTHRILVLAVETLTHNANGITNATNEATRHNTGRTFDRMGNLKHCNLIARRALEHSHGSIVGLIGLNGRNTLSHDSLSLLSSVYHERHVKFTIFRSPTANCFTVRCGVGSRRTLTTYVRATVREGLVSGTSISDTVEKPIRGNGNPRSIGLHGRHSSRRSGRCPTLPTVNLPTINLPPINLPPTPRDVRCLKRS